jgi:hypothetical protein
MTEPNNDQQGLPYVAALHHLRETEQRLPPDPSRKDSRDCPGPRKLMRLALGQAGDEADEIKRHTDDCRYCQLALQSLTAFVLEDDETPEGTSGEAPGGSCGTSD